MPKLVTTEELAVEVIAMINKNVDDWHAGNVVPKNKTEAARKNAYECALMTIRDRLDQEYDRVQDKCCPRCHHEYSFVRKVDALQEPRT